MRPLTLLILTFASLASGNTFAQDHAPLERIAFGSCAKQHKPQPIWDAIVETDPDLFILLGDNIYADTTDMQVMQREYARFAAQPAFKKLRRTTPLLATWDDHDYGENDAGRDYPKKAESAEVFLDFFDVPEDSPRRTRPGIYGARTFGPVDKRTQVILLDTRYFRSPLKRGYDSGEPGEGRRGHYVPLDDRQATLLGEAQWTWLEKQLSQPARLRIIASSIQVIPSEHGWEKWANLPHERQRLFELIRDTEADGVLFISGDRHMAELSRIQPEGGYPLYEVTSSSLNHPLELKADLETPSGDVWQNELNRHRLGLVWYEENFGTIQMDWSQKDPLLRLQVRDIDGGVVLQQRVHLSELKVSAN